MSKCSACGKKIDPSKDAVVVDADGKVYHEKGCYR